MADIKVARRYAKAILDLAMEMGQLNQVQQEMAGMATLLKENPQLAAVLRNPIISGAKKLAILQAVFGLTEGGLLHRFFSTVIAKDRAAGAEEIINEFLAQYDARHGVVAATVTSAVALSVAEVEKIKQLISAQVTASEIKLTNIVDASILGGFVIKVGDRQIDTSVKEQLARLKHSLAVN